MESCLKKLVWDPEATGFQDPEKSGWEPVGLSRRKTLLGGFDWRQTRVHWQPPGGQKTNSGLRGNEVLPVWFRLVAVETGGG
jgi:hypothetical protein